MAIYTVEEMNSRYAGQVMKGSTVVCFLSATLSEKTGKQNWRVLARCSCGKEYECAFETLRNVRNHPSCGCRRKKGGAASEWRTMSINPKRAAERAAEKAEKKEPKAKEDKERLASLGFVRPCIELAKGVSEARLRKLWEKLDQASCCSAWQGTPDKFVSWALSNGWHRNKMLVRVDTAKPWHPLNVRWENMA